MSQLINLFIKKNKADYFLKAKEFIDQDNRTNRNFNVITLEQMTKRHRVLFPDDFVKNKTILDFGACLGATGYWCLSAGAKKYVGVEAQKKNVEIGTTLLMKYFTKEKATIIHSSAEDFLNNNNETFDIVCLLGVMYVFVDYYSILEKVSKITKGSILVESMYHDTQALGANFCGVQFIPKQNISLADEKAYLVGKGSRISPQGLSFIMEGFGFKTKGLIYPEKILQSKDVFSVKIPTKEQVRYMIKFDYVDESKTKSLSEDLSNSKIGNRNYW